MESYWLACLVVFFVAYLVNICYITVFYHRGLSHGAVELSPSLKKFVVATGGWITGLDPKGWCCMHRLHHRYSDTPKDPHSPVHKGFFMIAYEQLLSYKRVLRGLLRREKYYTKIVADLDFGVSWTNKRGLWYMPYILHGAIAGILWWQIGLMLGLAYFLGIMSHPVQGWMVNSMGHALGYRNFNTDDNSRNNTLAAWLVAGEGFQNNHHRYPRAAKFSMRWWEIDWGYSLCLLFQALGLVTLKGTKDSDLEQPESWDVAEAQHA